MICWLDLETTCIEPADGAVLELGAVLTDAQLRVVSEFSSVVGLPAGLDPDAALDSLDPVIRTMHLSSGLWQDVLDCTSSWLEVCSEFVQWLDAHVDDRVALGGSGVSRFDRPWLRHHAPEVLDRFYYADFDVSPARRLLAMAQRPERPRGDAGLRGASDLPHRALYDAYEALADARHIVDLFGRVR